MAINKEQNKYIPNNKLWKKGETSQKIQMAIFILVYSFINVGLFVKSTLQSLVGVLPTANFYGILGENHK